jgi:hypothetical protein
LPKDSQASEQHSLKDEYPLGMAKPPQDSARSLSLALTPVRVLLPLRVPPIRLALAF